MKPEKNNFTQIYLFVLQLIKNPNNTIINAKIN